MRNFLNHHGLIFRYEVPLFTLLLLSSYPLKKFNIIFISFLILFFSSLVLGQVDTIYGFGYSKNIGDPFNAALLARQRALANALEKSKLRVSSTSRLIKENNEDKLNETIVSTSEGLIEKWREIKVIQSDGFIKSVVEVVITNQKEKHKQLKIKEIKQLLEINGTINLEKRINRLIKAYSIAKKYEIKEFPAQKILNRIELILSRLKISKVNNRSDINSYRVYESDKVLTSISLNKIPIDTNRDLLKTYYIVLDMGLLNYELVRLGLKIPSIKVNV